MTQQQQMRDETFVEEEDENMESVQATSNPTNFYDIAPGYKKEAVSNYTMARVIELHLQEIEVCSSHLISGHRQVRLFMHLSEFKRRKSIKSPTIDSKTTLNKPIPIQSMYHYQYIHHLRKNNNIFQVVLKGNGKQGNTYKTISIVNIDLDFVLQKPLDDVIVFRVRRAKGIIGDDSSGDEDPTIEQSQPTIDSTVQEGGVLAKVRMKLFSRPLTTDYQAFLIQQHQMQQEAKEKKKKKLNFTLVFNKKALPNVKLPLSARGRSESVKQEGLDMDQPESYDYADSDGDQLSDENSYDSGGERANPDNPKKGGFKRGLMKGWQFVKGVAKVGNSDDEEEGEHTTGERRPSMSIKVRKPKNLKTEASPATPPDLKDIDLESPRLPSFEPIQDQLENIFKVSDPSPTLLIRKVMLISAITKRGRLLAHYLRRNDGIFKPIALATVSYEDLVLSISKVLMVNNKVKKNLDYNEEEDDDQIKVVIVGTDRYVNNVLRACLQVAGNMKQVWNSFTFYIVPIPQDKARYKNSISQQIANSSPLYQDLFYADEWTKALSLLKLLANIRAMNQNVPDPSCEIVEHNILHYLQSAKQDTKLGIAQVMIDTDKSNSSSASAPLADTQGSTTADSSTIQTTIPCVSSIELSGGDVPLRRDNKQKNLLKRVQHVLSPMAGMSTPQDPIEFSPTEFHLKEELTQSQMQNDDEKQEEKELENGKDEGRLSVSTDKSGSLTLEAMELKLDYWFNNDKNKHTSKHHFHAVSMYKLPCFQADHLIEPEPNTFTLCTMKKPQAISLTSKNKAQGMKLDDKVTKIICKVESKKRPRICARIDGVQWHSVKFISISAQWPGGNQFKVAHFGTTQPTKPANNTRSLISMRSDSSLNLKEIAEDDELSV